MLYFCERYLSIFHIGPHISNIQQHIPYSYSIRVNIGLWILNVLWLFRIWGKSGFDLAIFMIHNLMYTVSNMREQEWMNCSTVQQAWNSLSSVLSALSSTLNALSSMPSALSSSQSSLSSAPSYLSSAPSVLRSAHSALSSDHSALSSDQCS